MLHSATYARDQYHSTLLLQVLLPPTLPTLNVPATVVLESYWILLVHMSLQRHNACNYSCNQISSPMRATYHLRKEQRAHKQILNAAARQVLTIIL